VERIGIADHVLDELWLCGPIEHLRTENVHQVVEPEPRPPIANVVVGWLVKLELAVLPDVRTVRRFSLRSELHPYVIVEIASGFHLHSLQCLKHV